MRSVLAVSVLLLVACSVAAQQPPTPDSAQRRAQQAAEMMGPMMQQMAPMMQQMAVLTMEGTLAALAKPENAEHLADFTKHTTTRSSSGASRRSKPSRLSWRSGFLTRQHLVGRGGGLTSA